MATFASRGYGNISGKTYANRCALLVRLKAEAVAVTFPLESSEPRNRFSRIFLKSVSIFITGPKKTHTITGCDENASSACSMCRWRCRVQLFLLLRLSQHLASDGQTLAFLLELGLANQQFSSTCCHRGPPARSCGHRASVQLCSQSLLKFVQAGLQSESHATTV